jgi:hypothetical protein
VLRRNGKAFNPFCTVLIFVFNLGKVCWLSFSIILSPCFCFILFVPGLSLVCRCLPLLFIIFFYFGLALYPQNLYILPSGLCEGCPKEPPWLYFPYFPRPRISCSPFLAGPCDYSMCSTPHTGGFLHTPRFISTIFSRFPRERRKLPKWDSTLTSCLKHVSVTHLASENTPPPRQYL